MYIKNNYSVTSILITNGTYSNIHKVSPDGYVTLATWEYLVSKHFIFLYQTQFKHEYNPTTEGTQPFLIWVYLYYFQSK